VVRPAVIFPDRGSSSVNDFEVSFQFSKIYSYSSEPMAKNIRQAPSLLPSSTFLFGDLAEQPI